MKRKERKHKAVFFDRDGVLNKALPERDDADGHGVRSPHTLEEFQLADGAEEVLEETKERGYVNIAITNQPGIKRGLLEAKELTKMHDFLKAELAMDDIFVCLHDDEDNCECRKPKPGMLFDAQKKWNIDFGKSFVVGDTWRDVGAGKAAGVRTILIDTDYNKDVRADARVDSLKGILDIV